MIKLQPLIKNFLPDQSNLRLRILKIAIVFIVLSVQSCIDSPEFQQQKPVIDGWIDSDGYPVVLFTSSVVPDENNSSIADHLIQWGVVTISDGEKEIIMTGGPSDKYFPPYRYVTFQMQGVPGKTYTITADYKDLHAESTCRMPYPTPISSIETFPIEGNDSLRAAEIRFVTPDDVPAYYYIGLRNLGESGRFMPTMLSTYKALIPGEEVSLPVMHPQNRLTDEEFVSHLKIGEQLEIQLCRVSEEVYEFWKSYEDAVLFGGTQFFASSQSLPGNICGGFGVWSAQGVSTTVLIVE